MSANAYFRVTRPSGAVMARPRPGVASSGPMRSTCSWAGGRTLMRSSRRWSLMPMPSWCSSASLASPTASTSFRAWPVTSYLKPLGEM